MKQVQEIDISSYEQGFSKRKLESGKEMRLSVSTRQLEMLAKVSPSGAHLNSILIRAYRTCSWCVNRGYCGIILGNHLIPPVD
jgi:hypothetical protein